MLTLHKCRIRVLDEGEGTPTLLLHGNPDSAEMWAGAVSILRGRLRCVAPDLPGFGASMADPDFDYSLKGMARFVNELLDAMNITEPVNLVAHDFGGVFALAWMTDYPQRVRRVALSNTTFFSDYSWHFWARVWRTPILGELSMAMMNRPVFALELRRGSRALTREHIQRTYAGLTPAVRRCVLRLYRAVSPGALAGWENRYLEHARRIPVIVLWGDGDPYIPDAYARRFGARKVIHYPDAGHWLPVVRPRDFASEVEQFFIDEGLQGERRLDANFQQSEGETS